jgi:hypothetical protein
MRSTEKPIASPYRKRTEEADRVSLSEKDRGGGELVFRRYFGMLERRGMRSSWWLSITLAVVVLACGRRGSGVSEGSDASSGSCTEDSDVNSSAQPAAYLWYHDVPQTGYMSGHLTVVLEPERVTGVTLGWWDYMLKGNVTARDLFAGDGCGLCIGTDIGQGNAEYGSNGLLP